jgi:hypothetical protein
MTFFHVTSPLPTISAHLAAQGYATLTLSPERARMDLMRLARALAGCGGSDLADEVTAYGEPIETRPSVDAPMEAPFNRPEAIGWHNDFSTRLTRPRLTLAYIDRPDPRGPQFGAWRVASCDDVFTRLRGSADGRRAIRFLRETPVPFLVSDAEKPVVFRAVEARSSAGGRLGLRFYARGIRRGSVAVYGHVPTSVDRAVRAVEDAADAEGVTVPAALGAVLIVDNWHCLHDRLPQSIDLDLPLRRALLCFVGGGRRAGA